MFDFFVLNMPDGFFLDTKKIEKILHHIHKNIPRVQRGVLNIAFLADDEIRALNHAHRGKDTGTDVLSFHYFDDFADIKKDETAGEVILSESHILRQAREHGHTPEEECLILIAHSILHILGFDHENDPDYEEMWEYESLIRAYIASL